MRTWFVTGTDTGIGKTTVASAILAAAGRRGLRTAAMKPAESGCPTGPDGALEPRDAMQLAAASSLQLPLDQVCPYRFAEAVAPGVAADREGGAIELAAVRRAWEALRALRPELLLVEGAGGLLVPLGGGRMVADLARELAAPLLVVARDSLGTINHTLLTVEVARHRGLDVGGIVLSDPAGDTTPGAAASNAAEIERAGGVRVLGSFGHARAGDLPCLADQAEARLDLATILGRNDR